MEKFYIATLSAKETPLKKWIDSLLAEADEFDKAAEFVKKKLTEEPELKDLYICQRNTKDAYIIGEWHYTAKARQRKPKTPYTFATAEQHTAEEIANEEMKETNRAIMKIKRRAAYIQARIDILGEGVYRKPTAEEFIKIKKREKEILANEQGH